MSEVVNLTALAEIIAALPECAGPRTKAGPRNTSEVTTIVSGDRYVEYITWLAAMVKAGPVLLDIARTALELSAAGAAFAACDNARNGEPRSLDHRRLELAAIRAEEVHLSALAKVSL